ncbi:MAG TPA: aldolase/citrate lyase family protein [bacterium]|nr:aldolase/citrate lyase family protein [bacterium]
MKNPVRRALLERRITLGSWLQVNHPVSAEILAECGFDWLATDCEHTDIDVGGFAQLARGMYGRGPVPFARVRENDTLAIRQMLDMGAQGVLVPLVNTPEEALKAVRAAKYPPRGIRGFCFSRMNNFGRDFEEYVKNANDEIAVIVMIESKQAVDSIDEILAVDGVDGIFIGPYDLSGSLGIPGQTSHPLILESCAKVSDACRRLGKSAGAHVVIPTPEAIEKTIADGFTFIALGIDTLFLREGATAALNLAKAVNSKNSA